MCADTPDDFPLAILAKAPLPGKAKTRLIPALGTQGAAQLQERLVRHTLSIALAATTARRIVLWTALDHAHPLFRELAERHDIECRAQPEGSLGDRMHYAFLEMGEPGLLIGSDCPALTPALLKRCHRVLADHEVVLLPAEDGGYALIGLREPDSQLFSGIDWGTAAVMDQTRQRVARSGAKLACPARVWDVDQPEDLDRLDDEFLTL
ncbi:TIGR04282 family arsenosugar biosynthesis glycosyltransferase [Chromohalobacter sarecensis]|uniref:TIGR04282 family arsenosugar biosynthesis glycosyltransferase n=1 Tax=Chromohalobacter sarecensis TaxID=245294 RepID=A0ABV9D2S8_9GAMM|nr:TIGR04282 family arsenosugar biosynthesis glycosyltransferase [Chromohalobacter sarecensis]MCK0716250.1 TIGR04282 family arsenosugar biosynthesis glycosyltransferase [Chromohalobacter sarecensis]